MEETTKNENKNDDIEAMWVQPKLFVWDQMCDSRPSSSFNPSKHDPIPIYTRIDRLFIFALPHVVATLPTAHESTRNEKAKVKVPKHQQQSTKTSKGAREKIAMSVVSLQKPRRHKELEQKNRSETFCRCNICVVVGGKISSYVTHTPPSLLPHNLHVQWGFSSWLYLHERVLPPSHPHPAFPFISSAFPYFPLHSFRLHTQRDAKILWRKNICSHVVCGGHFTLCAHHLRHIDISCHIFTNCIALGTSDRTAEKIKQNKGHEMNKEKKYNSYKT